MSEDKYSQSEYVAALEMPTDNTKMAIRFRIIAEDLKVAGDIDSYEHLAKVPLTVDYTDDKEITFTLVPSLYEQVYITTMFELMEKGAKVRMQAIRLTQEDPSTTKVLMLIGPLTRQMVWIAKNTGAVNKLYTKDLNSKSKSKPKTNCRRWMLISAMKEEFCFNENLDFLTAYEKYINFGADRSQ